jgi:hypothetical protein
MIAYLFQVAERKYIILIGTLRWAVMVPGLVADASSDDIITSVLRGSSRAGCSRQGGTQMLSYDDCLGFCDLTPEEIAAIARHEHLPEILALELGAHLCTTPEGKGVLKRMIRDDIKGARPSRHDAGAGDAERPRPADATISRCFPTRTPSPAIDGPTTEPTRYQLPDTTAAKRAAAQVLADRRGGEAASG